MFTIYGGKTEFKQWDLDQKVVNPNMCDCEQVIFTMSNGRVGVSRAYEYEGQMVADVPNHLLKYNGNMMVDLEQGAEQRIDEKTYFTVVECEQPEGYVCTTNRNLAKKYLETVAQELTEAEKAQVRKNIGAGEGGGSLPMVDDFTVYGDTLTWDGNIEGRIKAEGYSNLMPGYEMYRVSDVVVTADAITNAEVERSHSVENGVYHTGGTTADADTIVSTVDMGVMMGSDIIYVLADNTVISAYGVTFPKAGVYFIYKDKNNYKADVTIKGFSGFPTTTKSALDPEYLPKAAPVLNLNADGNVTAKEIALRFNTLLKSMRDAGYLAE